MVIIELKQWSKLEKVEKVILLLKLIQGMRFARLSIHPIRRGRMRN